MCQPQCSRPPCSPTTVLQISRPHLCTHVLSHISNRPRKRPCGKSLTDPAAIILHREMNGTAEHHSIITMKSPESRYTASLLASITNHDEKKSTCISKTHTYPPYSHLASLAAGGGGGFSFSRAVCIPSIQRICCFFCRSQMVVLPSRGPCALDIQNILCE